MDIQTNGGTDSTAAFVDGRERRKRTATTGVWWLTNVSVKNPFGLSGGENGANSNSMKRKSIYCVRVRMEGVGWRTMGGRRRVFRRQVAVRANEFRRRDSSVVSVLVARVVRRFGEILRNWFRAQRRAEFLFDFTGFRPGRPRYGREYGAACRILFYGDRRGRID